MIKHGPHRLPEVFLLLNLVLLSSVKMPPTRLHTRRYIHSSLQNRSSQAHVLALPSEKEILAVYKEGSVMKEEVIQHFIKDRDGKVGVREKVEEVLERH